MPTLLDYLGLSYNDYIQGRSFSKTIRKSSRSDEGNTILSRQKVPPGNQIYSLRDRHYKLISDLETGRGQLFDLKTDPEEKNNLADKNPVLTRELEKKLREIIRDSRDMAESTNRSPEKAELSEEEVKRLKSLGYFAD